MLVLHVCGLAFQISFESTSQKQSGSVLPLAESWLSVLQLDETAEKLDSMMTLVFQHISKCREDGQLAATWQALLDSFFVTVLDTHRSKFTQFLLWYILDMVSSHSAASRAHSNAAGPTASAAAGILKVSHSHV